MARHKTGGGRVEIGLIARASGAVAIALFPSITAAADEPPPPPPPSSSPVAWILDVRAVRKADSYGLWPKGGGIPLARSPWSCRYSAIDKVAKENTAEESVTLTCRNGDAVIENLVSCAYLVDPSKAGYVSNPNQARLRLRTSTSASGPLVIISCVVVPPGQRG